MIGSLDPEPIESFTAFKAQLPKLATKLDEIFDPKLFKKKRGEGLAEYLAFKKDINKVQNTVISLTGVNALDRANESKNRFSRRFYSLSLFIEQN